MCGNVAICGDSLGLMVDNLRKTCLQKVPFDQLTEANLQRQIHRSLVSIFRDTCAYRPMLQTQPATPCYQERLEHELFKYY